MGDFYHRMADYRKAGDCLTDAYEMAITFCPTDLVSALASFHLGNFCYHHYPLCEYIDYCTLLFTHYYMDYTTKR